MNSNNTKRIVSILTIIIIFFMPIALFIANQKSANYKKNGIKVTATVTQTGAGRRNRNRGRAEYLNREGQQVEAAIQTNLIFPMKGRKVTAYYLPSNPWQLYQPPSLILMLIIDVVVGAAWLISAWKLFGIFFYNKQRHTSI